MSMYQFGNDIGMEGRCPHCGKRWEATGKKQPGCNEGEPIICPHCDKATGETMHCAFGPFVDKAEQGEGDE